MNILTILRKPQFAIYASLFMLFFSCSQYEIRNNAFDYAFFNEQKNNKVFDKIYEKVKAINFERRTNSNLEFKKEILEIVNSEVGTDINLSDEILELSDYSGNEVLDIAQNKGWISETDKSLLISFNNDFESENFDTAIENYENSVLSMNLSEEEFVKKNNFANIIKLVNSEINNPNESTVNREMLSSRSWGCFFAIIGWIVAIVGLFACATVILCGVALIGYGIAVRHLFLNCLLN